MREMRRKDREMDKDFAYAVIDKARFGTISVVDKDGTPYGVHVSIVRDGDTLYFHSAPAGRKVDAFEGGARVCVNFVGRVHVPDNYTNEELDEIVKDPEQVTMLIRNVFTTEFESAVVEGMLTKVEDEEEKRKVFRLVCAKFVPSKAKYVETAIDSGKDRANAYKIEILDIKGKRKRYDKNREEMKWGRME